MVFQPLLEKPLLHPQPLCPLNTSFTVTTFINQTTFLLHSCNSSSPFCRIRTEMNDGEAAKKEGFTVVVSATAANGNAPIGGVGGLFSKTRYKFWAIAAILLLALWSMFTGSVSLKWSGAGNDNNPLSDSFDSPVRDLDILEVEEREKLVRRFWNVYTHSKTTPLPRFWREAFEAAYEHLTSDVQEVRDTAVSEIAKMSLVSVDVEPLPLNTDLGGRRKRLRHGVGGKTGV